LKIGVKEEDNEQVMVEAQKQAEEEDKRTRAHKESRERRRTRTRLSSNLRPRISSSPYQHRGTNANKIISIATSD